MSFDDDARGKDFRADPEFFARPAVTIRVLCPAHPELGEQVIELPELKLTREQVSPEWLAMHDAEPRQAEREGEARK